MKSIVYKTSQNGGRDWSYEKTFIATERGIWGNPSCYYDRDSGILFVQVIEESSGKTLMFQSRDGGKRFDMGVRLTRDAIGTPAAYPGPGRGVKLDYGVRAGRIMFCGWWRSLDGVDKWSVVWYSDDMGASWYPSKLDQGTLLESSSNECQIVQGADGDVRVYMRTNTDRIYLMTSEDGGTTFGPRYQLDEMFTVVVQFGMLYFKDQYFWAISNGNDRFGNHRGHLTVYSSKDGKTGWIPVAEILEGPSAYNNLVAIDDHTIGIIYEQGSYNPSEKISFSTFYIP